MPAVKTLLYLDEQRQVVGDGHEIGIHGWIHELNSVLPYAAERDVWMLRCQSFWPYTPPAAVFENIRREFDAAYDEGGLFQLTMHLHVIGYRSRIWILEELIRHARERGNVWFATHAEVVEWACAHADQTKRNLTSGEPALTMFLTAARLAVAAISQALPVAAALRAAFRKKNSRTFGVRLPRAASCPDQLGIRTVSIT